MATLQGSPAAAVQYSGTNQVNQSGFPIKPDAFYDKLLLKMLRQMEFHYAKYAVEKSLPKNFGDKINWRRFKKLAVTKTALTEGVTPNGQQIGGSFVEALIYQYGNVLYFTDIIDLQQLDRVRQEYTVELGFQARETLDEIVRDHLATQASVYFAGGKEAASELLGTDVPSIDDFRKITLSMKKAFIGGNRKAGGKYVALISPDVMAALFDDQRVKDFMQWGQTNTMFADGMIIDMFGIRFEEVLNAPINNNGEVDVHDSIIIGEEAYAVTKLEGAGLQVITKGLGSAGVEDPLDQRQSIGWKITGFGVAILNQAAVVNYKSVPGFLDATPDAFYTLNVSLAADAEATLGANTQFTVPAGQDWTVGMIVGAAAITYDEGFEFGTVTYKGSAATLATVLDADGAIVVDAVAS